MSAGCVSDLALMTLADARELAQRCYVAPEAAAVLIRLACAAEASDIQRRALQALRWLDLDDEDPPLRFAHGGAGDVLARAIVTLAHTLVYHSDHPTRQRCAGLVSDILAEAAKLTATERGA